MLVASGRRSAGYGSDAAPAGRAARTPPARVSVGPPQARKYCAVVGASFAANPATGAVQARARMAMRTHTGPKVPRPDGTAPRVVDPGVVRSLGAREPSVARPGARVRDTAETATGNGLARLSARHAHGLWFAGARGGAARGLPRAGHHPVDGDQRTDGQEYETQHGGYGRGRGPGPADRGRRTSAASSPRSTVRTRRRRAPRRGCGGVR